METGRERERERTQGEGEAGEKEGRGEERRGGRDREIRSEIQNTRPKGY